MQLPTQNLSQNLGRGLLALALALAATGCFQTQGNEELKNGGLGIRLQPVTSKSVISVPGKEIKLSAKIIDPENLQGLEGISIDFKQLSEDGSKMSCQGEPLSTCTLTSGASGLASVLVQPAPDNPDEALKKSSFESTISGTKTSITFTVEVNRKPTNLELRSSIGENLTLQMSPDLKDTPIGTFLTSDPNTDDQFIYSLVPGEGDSDNSSVLIRGNTLILKASSLACEKNYSVRIRSTDLGGMGGVEENWIEKVFTFSVISKNPTNVLLSSESLPENNPLGELVAQLTSQDPNFSGNFSYSLVPGTGDADNSKFTVAGSALKTAVANLDY
ncbi:MAG: cadherin repeat domain-containing protein, partial [Bdellovibrionales bacterium]|nr:cadherin repeat domain-containing protein [Bdellovibrionales bacterium]